MLTSAHYRKQLEKLPCLSVPADAVQIHHSASEFKNRILQLIATARVRIYLVALYLQDDEAGREILDALRRAKEANPQLEIRVFVDFHRAQRGLIGKGKQAGNHLLYQEFASQHPNLIQFYGVPVKRREWMGVLHLKGFLFDDTLLYSGASLNNIYLQQQERYRFDRYHEITDSALASSWARFIQHYFLQSPAVKRLDLAPVPLVKSFRGELRRLRSHLQKARYDFAPALRAPGEVGITPLVGLGKLGNRLNKCIRDLLRGAKEEVFICTPYFNPPKYIAKDIDRLLRRGVRLTLVVGDKTANDFYIPPEEPFKAIGALPYLYEANLRRFCKAHKRAIDAGTLNVHLWRHEDNTFHLKGLLVDGNYALLTGNNLNPRAWRLDLENGLLIHDPLELLLPQHLAELERIMAHTQRLASHEAIEPVESYPAPVQRLLRRLARVRADRLVNQVL